MPTTIQGQLYDYPHYYDLVFGSDWKAEYDFILACCRQFAKRRVRRMFEPACGTGRLIFRLARAGYRVGGNDLNPRAVAYCNRRLRRHGLKATATVGDMADFRLPRPADAAFNTINSFRHLSDERSALGHLRSMAAALAPGGIYLLGLHLTPADGSPSEPESWPARRGNLAVLSRMWTTRIDLARRQEWVSMCFDVWTPRRQFRIEQQIAFRTYTAVQFRRLLGRVRQFEVAATFDFAYDLEQPIDVDDQTEDVVYVLRRR